MNEIIDNIPQLNLIFYISLKFWKSNCWLYRKESQRPNQNQQNYTKIAEVTTLKKWAT